MLDLGTLYAQVQVDAQEGIKSLQDFGTEVNNAEKSSATLGTSLKGMLKGLGITAALGLVVSGLKGVFSASEELQQSYDTLQAKTGATEEEMVGLEETLKNIYANNYGDSFEDIAEVLAQVETQTGLTGEELQSATENALLFRDTFGYDTQESINAVNMMMKQFGISSDEAFNLIAQGSQAGLDQNGNLLESINEYSVHFKQLGLDADDMFNMFANGAEAGVFDIDKLGDAVKEFGIRVKDSSAETSQAFESLGFDANDMQAKFAAGGDTAKQAFSEVMTALNNCDNEVLKNQIGVQLFGTMWEDLGDEAVGALGATNDELAITEGMALDLLQENRFNTFSEAFEAIKRSILMGIVPAITENLLPVFSDMANWLMEHMPQIQATIETVVNVIITVINSVIEVIKVVVQQAQEEGTVFNAIWENCKAVIETVFNFIMDLLKVFSALFQGDWSALWDAVKNLFSNLWENIKNILKTQLDALVALIKAAASAFKAAATALFNKIKEGFTEVWNNIKSWFKTSINDIKTAITNNINEFKEAGKAIFTAVWDGIKGVWDSISSWVSDKVNWLIDKLAFWRSGQSEMSDGSHRNGLTEVPFDGYRAILHKGEMVLTQPEADRYRSGQGVQYINTNPNPVTNINVSFEGNLSALGRVLYPVIKKEETRKGVSLLGGATV